MQGSRLLTPEGAVEPAGASHPLDLLLLSDWDRSKFLGLSTREIQLATVLLGRLYSRRDCIPAFTIRHGRSLHEESAILNLVIEALERNRSLLSPTLAERDRWKVVYSPGDAFDALCFHP